MRREYVERHGAEILNTPTKELGRIWGKAFDLDIAATLLDGSVVFGECKWTRAGFTRELQRRRAYTPFLHFVGPVALLGET